MRLGLNRLVGRWGCFISQ